MKYAVKNVLEKALELMGSRSSPDEVVPRQSRVIAPVRKAKRILTQQLFQPVEWKHEDLGLTGLHNSRYYNIWKNFDGGHKKYSYFELYDKLFNMYSGKHPKVLEIGVYKGASIRTWKEFFGEGSTIVGIDINADCARFEVPDQDIHVRIGDQSDPQFLKGLCDEFGTFDIIMDDGSHFTHHVIASFNCAFLHCLAEGGVYFIEDLNTSYWDDYRTSKYSAMDMVLSLCEMMHQFYCDNAYQDYAIDNHKAHYVTPLVSTIVSEVRVFDSAAAIYKKAHYPPLVFHT
jgi:hypothetical protein